MPYNTYLVTNSFLCQSFSQKIPIDPMKAQKLTYFAHGYYLALTHKPLINEYFQAWKLGPVAPSLYQDLKIYRGNDIEDYINSRGIFNKKLNNDKQFIQIRDFVWDTYKDANFMKLSNLTHKKGYAWDRTLEKNPGIIGPPILNEDIERDFASLVKKDG